jgi:hypothetical protein
VLVDHEGDSLIFKWIAASKRRKTTQVACLRHRGFLLWWCGNRDSHVLKAAHSQFGYPRVCYSHVGACKGNLLALRRVSGPDVVLGRIGVICHSRFLPRWLAVVSGDNRLAARDLANNCDEEYSAKRPLQDAARRGGLIADGVMRTGTRGSPSWPGLCPQIP